MYVDKFIWCNIVCSLGIFLITCQGDWRFIACQIKGCGLFHYNLITLVHTNSRSYNFYVLWLHVCWVEWLCFNSKSVTPCIVTLLGQEPALMQVFQLHQGLLVEPIRLVISTLLFANKKVSKATFYGIILWVTLTIPVH